MTYIGGPTGARQNVAQTNNFHYVTMPLDHWLVANIVHYWPVLIVWPNNKSVRVKLANLVNLVVKTNRQSVTALGSMETANNAGPMCAFAYQSISSQSIIANMQ